MSYFPDFIDKMIVTPTSPACIHANIQLPASKSISNRALIIKALLQSQKLLRGLSDCDDTNVLQKALTFMPWHIDVGAAGTAMRFLTAYLAQTSGEHLLTGTERMKQRPIGLLVDVLNRLGADITYSEKNGFPPLLIKGKQLAGGEVELKGDVSSQYVSALMMVAPYMQKGLILRLIPPVISKPYIELTRQIMLDFGVSTKWENNTLIIPSQYYRDVDFSVESDWSAASYWYEILAFQGHGEVFLPGLREQSYQGDSKIAQLFSQFGVSTYFESSGVRIKADRNNFCRYVEYNFVDEPDLTQTCAVTCCFLRIPFCFTGLHNLKIKETDRIAALRTELLKFGFVLEEPHEGFLTWTGKMQPAQTNPIVTTYNDHRMAMAFAPACIITPLSIDDAQVVTKSYPLFWDDLKAAGFDILSNRFV